MAGSTVKPRLVVSVQDFLRPFVSTDGDTVVVRVTNRGDVCVVEVFRNKKPFPPILQTAVRAGDSKELAFKATE
jgi:hypothetical protein